MQARMMDDRVQSVLVRQQSRSRFERRQRRLPTQTLVRIFAADERSMSSFFTCATSRSTSVLGENLRRTHSF